MMPAKPPGPGRRAALISAIAHSSQTWALGFIVRLWPVVLPTMGNLISHAMIVATSLSKSVEVAGPSLVWRLL